MNWNWKENNREKHLFRSYYCFSCKQVKPCGVLGEGDYCCECYFKNELEQAQEYLDYQVVFQQEVKDRLDSFQQLQLLKSYSGCSQCGSKEVVLVEWKEGRLVCQPCQMAENQKNLKYDEKTGRCYYEVPGRTSLAQERKTYEWWGIDLGEWLEKFQCLPVNAECAKEWVKDKRHLESCQCLEKVVKKAVELQASSLKEKEEKLKGCECVKSEKTRTLYYDWANYGYTYCEKCEVEVKGAGKTGVIKNRNDPRFWGLEIEEKVLCLECLKKLEEQMPTSKGYRLNKYLKRGY